MAELSPQMQGFHLTTAQIIYRMPDHQHLLQEYVWQDYDLPPSFPVLKKFLNFWVTKLDGPIHAVYVARQQIITASDYRRADWLETV